MSISKKLQALTAHMLMTVIILVSMSAAATAQTTPTSPEQNKATQQRGTTPQSPQQGWQWFDDEAAHDMDLNEQSQAELREMDMRYRREYDALGDPPWMHSKYQALTDRRNAEVQSLLTPHQYEQWSSRSSTMDRGTKGGISPSPDRGTMAPRH